MTTGKIILVDDNDGEVALMQHAMHRKNMVNEIIRARDAAACLHLIFDEHNNVRLLPALIILDLKLPALNGIDALGTIRSHKQTRDLPVILLTTSAEDEEVAHRSHPGANSYIRKPMEFRKFIDAVAILGFYWMILNETSGCHG